MKAAMFQAKGKISLIEREQPCPSNGEVLVKVKSCGICGTDQHIFHGQPGSAAVTPPLVLGHELSGEIIEVGPNVSLNVGDRVSIDPNIYCGNCAYCRSGRVHLCDNLEAIGVTRDGGMAEQCVVPAENCYLIPNEMSYEEAALVEPLGCVLHGVRKLDIKPGSTVLIVGGGFIGQLFLQLVKQTFPASIVVSEPFEEKHEFLRSLGADLVVNPLKETVTDAGSDIVIECVGRQDSMETAVKAARKGGQVLLFGVSSPDTEIAVSPFEIFSKELKIFGSFINPHTHLEAIELISQGVVQIEQLISHRFKLNEIPEVMENYPSLGVSKGIVVPGRMTF
jgi:L-iditol 2-dehydrogenase